MEYQPFMFGACQAICTSQDGKACRHTEEARISKPPWPDLTVGGGFAGEWRGLLLGTGQTQQLHITLENKAVQEQDITPAKAGRRNFIKSESWSIVTTPAA